MKNREEATRSVAWSRGARLEQKEASGRSIRKLKKNRICSRSTAQSINPKRLHRLQMSFGLAVDRPEKTVQTVQTIWVSGRLLHEAGGLPGRPRVGFCLF